MAQRLSEDLSEALKPDDKVVLLSMMSEGLIARARLSFVVFFLVVCQAEVDLAKLQRRRLTLEEPFVRRMSSQFHAHLDIICSQLLQGLLTKRLFRHSAQPHRDEPADLLRPL